LSVSLNNIIQAKATCATSCAFEIFGVDPLKHHKPTQMPNLSDQESVPCGRLSL